MCGNMTFPEVGQMPLKQEQTKMSICLALKESLLEAQNEGRLTHGICSCAKLLELAPETIMLCLVPVEDSSDVTNVLLHTLVEAFCWENEIRMLKVDSSKKLAKVLTGNSDVVNDNASSCGRDDVVPYSCVLIQYPDKDFSPSDEKVIEHYNKLMCSNNFPTPVIEIPV